MSGLEHDQAADREHDRPVTERTSVVCSACGGRVATTAGRDVSIHTASCPSTLR